MNKGLPNTGSTLKYQKICEFGVVLMIALASITSLINIKGTYFIQPQEIIFLLFLPFNLIFLRKIKIFTSLDWLFIFYLFIFLLNTIIHKSSTTLFETIGVFYLFTSYLIISRVVAYSKNVDLLLRRAILSLLIISIITGLFGYLIHVLGISNRFVYFYKDYPYFGDVWRVNGFTWSNLLLSIISFCLFFLPQTRLSFRWKIFLTICSFVVAVLTFSKEIVVLIGLFIYLLYALNTRKFSAKFLVCYAGILAAIMIVFTFFIVKPSNLKKSELNVDNIAQIGHEPIFKIANLEFYPTTYFYLFQSSIELIKQHPISGIGSGMFKKELANVKEIYPENFKKYDTHDFYWGQLAELGILYLFFLIFLFREAYKVIVNKNAFIPNKYHLAFSLIFLYFLICFLVGGSKHYRHLWIFFGLINAFIIRSISSRQLTVEPQNPLP